MYYYAITNSKYIVQDFTSSDTEISDPHYIEITSTQYANSSSISSKWYDYVNSTTGNAIFTDVPAWVSASDYHTGMVAVQFTELMLTDFLGDCDLDTTATNITDALNELNTAVNSADSGITTGTYTGSGVLENTITLSDTPTAVFVCRDDGAFCGMATTSTAVIVGGNTALEIVSGGFKASRRTGCPFNSSTHSYNYFVK